MPLRLTFELYLDTGEEEPAFEALTCLDEVELLGVMRRMLAERRLKSIEARRLGETIVTLTE